MMPEEMVPDAADLSRSRTTKVLRELGIDLVRVT